MPSKLKLSSHLFIILIAMFLSGCMSTQTPIIVDSNASFFNHSMFVESELIQIETPAQIFELNQPAKAFVDDIMQLNIDTDEKIKLLAKRIFARSDLDMLYSAKANTIAADTFSQAAANCLSLSIMTHSMAKYAGLTSQFQQVKIPEYWTRRDGYSLLNGHVNLRIKAKKTAGIYQVYNADLVVDFDNRTRGGRFSTQMLDKSEIVAMFYNNKGADYLVNGQASHAYQYFKAAIINDARFTGAWVNLGLLYRKLGKFELAESAYQQAISINPDNLTAWENLAVLYQYQGDTKSSKDILNKIEKKRLSNPYFHLMLAETELEKGQWDKSIAHYLDAIELDKGQHLFYFGLAMAYYQKGELNKTGHYLRKAKRKTQDYRVEQSYASKLTLLKSLNNP